MQGNESIEEQEGEEMVSKESIMLEGAHDVILEANEPAFDQPSMVHEDKQFAKWRKWITYYSQWFKIRLC